MDELSLPTKIRVIDRAVLYDELDTRATHERKTNTAMTIREITPTLRCKNVLERFVGPRIRHQKERHLSGRRKRITRQQFLAMIDAQSPKPITVSSPDAETSQLHATLLDLYMPESGGDQISFRSFLDVASSNEALSSAATALSLLLVGRAENDLRILFAASTYCSGALQKAYQEVGSPGTSKCIVFGIGQLGDRPPFKDYGGSIAYEVVNMLIMQQHSYYRSTMRSRKRRSSILPPIHMLGIYWPS